jgi:tetratricopeptide (TPR) repeat protein
MEQLDRAVAELEGRNFGSAVRSLELLTAQDPMNPEAWKHLARAYHGAGEKQQAADAAVRYTALRPTDAGGHYTAGRLLWQVGQRDAAERALRAALAADPGHAKAREALYKLTEEPAPATPARAAKPAAPEKRAAPWQGKAAAALTVLASLAIVAWLFMPGGPANRGPKSRNPQDSPAAITTPPPTDPNANDPSIEQLPQPTNPQLQPGTGELLTPSPTERPPIQPMPEAKQPDQATPAAQQVWRQLWQRPQAQNSQEQQYSHPGLPIPLDQLAAAAKAGPGQTAPEGGPAGTQAGPAPTEQGPAGPARGTQPARPAQPQPQAQGQPAPQPQQPQPLFTPADAQRVAETIDQAERAEIEGALGYLAEWLRRDPACNDEDFWPILQTALATTGPSMAPEGLSFGSAEVMSLIVNAPSAQQAARDLEFHSRNLRGVLPQNVKLQIAQVLASATSAEEAYVYVDTILRQNNTAVSNYATQVLMEAVRRAEIQRARMERR